MALKDVYVVSDNIISPVGKTSAENFYALIKGISGIRLQHRPSISAEPFYASLLEEASLSQADTASFTKFEQMLVRSVQTALQHTGINISDPSTIVIISSTKGNISLLEKQEINNNDPDQIGLPVSAKKISAYFSLANTPLIISNACISGLTALLTGRRLLQMGKYTHAVVAGADVISSFILSGFQSFQAISAQPCRPFDAERKGISLGEAAATIILSTEKNNNTVMLTGGAITNDANHISGPSRSGQELCIAINKAMQQANVSAADIGFISAHGTATVYNDEMEAKAFSLAGMESIPANSLKGYYGHTLGAAGLVESVIAIHTLQQNTMIATKGYQQPGVSKPMNICMESMPVQANHCLKTASGFGGCNAALVFSKTLN
jgi:3-oxoacyl-[acyl-carrier-protein] synthase-1